MIVLSVVVAIAMAVLARRVAWVRDRLPPPAVTALLLIAAFAAVLALAALPDSVWRVLAAAPATAVLGAVALLAGGWFRDRVVDPVQTRVHASDGPTVRERLTARADAVPFEVAGWRPLALAVRSGYRSTDVRVTGLAAEMSYYALISLVPIITALGSSLGYLRRIVGDDQVDEIQTSIVDALTTVFAEQVASDVLAPLVEGLLSEERTGFAVGALLITLYLASRMFRAAVRALDDAYRVPSRRSVIGQYALGLVFTIFALTALVTVALLVVIGPLLGDGAKIADTFGFSGAFATAWQVLRWPVSLLVGCGFLLLLYRYAPNVETTWSRCLPGAVVATVGVLLVSAGFNLYVRIITPAGLEVEAGGTAVVQAAAQMFSLVLAGVLWVWLVSIVVLLGGILNAEIDAERQGRSAVAGADAVSDDEPRRTP